MRSQDPPAPTAIPTFCLAPARGLPAVPNPVHRPHLLPSLVLRARLSSPPLARHRQLHAVCAAFRLRGQHLHDGHALDALCEGTGCHMKAEPPWTPQPLSPVLTDDVELSGEAAIAVQDAAAGLSLGRLALHQQQWLRCGSSRGTARGHGCGSSCGICYGFSCSCSCGSNCVPIRGCSCVHSRVHSGGSRGGCGHVPCCPHTCSSPKQRSGWKKVWRDLTIPSQDPPGQSPSPSAL